MNMKDIQRRKDLIASIEKSVIPCHCCGKPVQVSTRPIDEGRWLVLMIRKEDKAFSVLAWIEEDGEAFRDEFDSENEALNAFFSDDYMREAVAKLNGAALQAA